MSRHGAVAIDMGASSARFASGWIESGKIRSRTIEQIHHEPIHGKWNTALLKSLCESAVQYAHDNFDSATVGLDTWGVDHGFISTTGELVQDPVAYRDESHTSAFDEMVGHRKRLYSLTGIQHQPFNTIYQLAARSKDSPHLKGERWLLLPDLFGFLLTGVKNYEATQCSTTQLVGTDGLWCPEAFETVGWDVPGLQPSLPGRTLAKLTEKVSLVSVASHDTASAVCGLGTLNDTDLFLNMGTWSLLGTIIASPMTSPTAEDGGWTNERAHDGRVRFLKNIPGFYIVNRLHEELAVTSPVAEWLSTAVSGPSHSFDYFHRSLYSPDSMVAAVKSLTGKEPQTHQEWASLALNSMMASMVSQPTLLGEVTNRQFERIRVSGGGSQSRVVCQGLADATGLQVVSGPTEATLLGNLGMQFVASGQLSLRDLPGIIDASTEVNVYEPRG